MSLSTTDKLQRTIRKMSKELIALHESLRKVRAERRKYQLAQTRAVKQVEELRADNLRLRREKRQLFIDLTDPPGSRK